MSEVSSSDWSETDASNTASVPDGWPEGQPGASVNNCARAMMGALKRSWDRINPVHATTGSSNAYVVTPSVALASYANYEIWTLRPNFTNSSTTPTLNISSLGAKTVKKYVGGSKVAVAVGDVSSGRASMVWYDGTDFVLLNPPGGFSNPMTTAGDIIVGGASGTASRLAVGTSSAMYLGVSSSAPAWKAFGATQAEMEAASSGVVAATPGNLVYGPSAAKAWVTFSTNGTVLDSHNITSVVESTTGRWVVTLSITMDSATYPAVPHAYTNTSNKEKAAQVTGKTTTTVQIDCTDTTTGNLSETGVQHITLIVYGTIA